MSSDPQSSPPNSPLSASLLDAMLASAPVVVAFVDPEHRYLAASDALARFHGVARNELVGRRVAEVLPELWSTLEPIYERVLEHGETISDVELHHLHPGRSEELCWLANYYPVYGAAGDIIAAGIILFDITERRRAASLLREREKRLAYALEAASEGLWDWNVKTGSTYYSPGWIESLGYAPEEVDPHISFWQGLIHPEDAGPVRAALQNHFEGKSNIYRAELRLRKKSGEYRWDVCRGKVVERSEDGTPERMIGTDIDITPRKEAEEALHRLNATLESRVAQRTAELAEANRALAERAGALERLLHFKSEFVANMSHELRTPLNSLLILARLLGDNAQRNLTEQQVQYARTIGASGEDLLQIIDDILDFSRTESGALTLHYEPVAFADVIRTLQRTFRHIAEDKGLDFMIGTSPALPYSMETDPMRLRQILANLLSNAFKFTDQGRVSLNIYPVAKMPGQNGNMIAFEVSDTGIGIAPDEREIVFEAFRQADAGTARKYGGTGLGLAICRQLVISMGGTITLRSDPGKGSTFTAFLPRTQIGAAIAAPAEPPSVSTRAGGPLGAELAGIAPATVPSAGRMKILVVDDDARNRFSLGAVLETEGYEVVTAASGELALDMLERQPDIACVLVDVMMPGMDGYETTRRIRAQPRFERLCIIGVTAKATAADLQKCLEAGCTEYITKPVDSRRLLEIIRALIRT